MVCVSVFMCYLSTPHRVNFIYLVIINLTVHADYVLCTSYTAKILTLRLKMCLLQYTQSVFVYSKCNTVT